MVTIKTRFENGSISFDIGKRVVKLSAGTISEMMGLIRPDVRVGGDKVSLFVQFWRENAECIAGPNREMVEEWDSTPCWEHAPYITCSEFIEILGLLHERDLTSLADFTGEVSFRISPIYRRWNMSRQGAGYVPDRNRTATVLISEDEFQKMRADMQRKSEENANCVSIGQET